MNPETKPSADKVAEEFRRIYKRRFDLLTDYRLRVWERLCRSFFQAMIPPNAFVLDLGCGYGQFINRIQAEKKYGMDLNPTALTYLDSDVSFLQQDCSTEWDLPDNHLDIVFTSNFFEHLLSRSQLHDCIDQAATHLKPGGAVIAMGPNIRVLHGHYWDFIDHSLALTDLSMQELFELHGLQVTRCHKKFLPYRMTHIQPPLWTVDLYVKSPLFWKLFGKQFLVVAKKPA